MNQILTAIAVGLVIGFYTVAGLAPEVHEPVLFVTVATLSAFWFADALEYVAEMRENPHD